MNRAWQRGKPIKDLRQTNSRNSGHRTLGDVICVFVSSSDPTRDVFEKVFAHFDRMWPGCPFPRFVGLTTRAAGNLANGFVIVPAIRGHGWREELAAQIESLPASIGHILLLLDDFLLLQPVNGGAIAGAAEIAAERNLAYLRLIPPARGAIMASFRYALSRLTGEQCRRLPSSEPYYSSLQAAIWRRDHLLKCLKEPGSIWDFEHFVPNGEAHWAVTRRLLHYRHVVQRSVWRAYAPQLFARVGLTFERGARPIRSRLDILYFMWEIWKFAIFGYAKMRLKSWMRTMQGRRVISTKRTG